MTGWVILGILLAVIFGLKLALVPLIVITIIIVAVAIYLRVTTRGAELAEMIGIAAVGLAVILLIIMWGTYGFSTGVFARVWSSLGILR